MGVETVSFLSLVLQSIAIMLIDDLCHDAVYGILLSFGACGSNKYMTLGSVMNS